MTDSKQEAEEIKRRAAAAGITVKQAFKCAGHTPKAMCYWLRGGTAKKSTLERLDHVLRRYEALQEELLAELQSNQESDND